MSVGERAVVWGVLAAGIFLRAFCLDLFEFKTDELEGITRGLAAPAQHWWIGHGAVSSAHIPFGPAFSYIMGFFAEFSQNPYTLTGFIVLANIIILLFSVLFFAEFSRDKGQFILCVLLFSLSPYSIIFSRKIWQPNLLLLFVIPLVLMILRAGRNPRLYLPIGLLASIIVQLHHSGLFYMPLLVGFAVWAELSKSIREAGELGEHSHDPPGPESSAASKTTGRRDAALWAAAGFTVFIVFLIPYLTYLIHHFRQTGINQWISGGISHLCVQGALKWVLFMATGSDFWRYMFSGKAGYWDWPFFPLPGVVLIFCYFLIIPFLLGFWKYAQAAVRLAGPKSHGPTGPPDFKNLLCPLSIGYLFVVYCFILDHGRPHHYTVILPFLILALSEGIIRLFESRKKWSKIGRELLYLGMVSYVLQYPFVLMYVNANNGSPGEYGISYREQKNAAKKIAVLAGRSEISINPLAVYDESSFSRKAELQETIAYICKTEFGTEVKFNSNPEPGAIELRLLKTGQKLHFEIGGNVKTK